MTFEAWDLKEIIFDLVAKSGSIEEVYLFGSRGHRTNSYRSDIDLLMYSPLALPAVLFGEWINTEYNPVDLFETNDHKNARSLVNGSAIHAAEGTVEQKLNAVPLWSKANGFSNFNHWIQQTIQGLTFAMTILPTGNITSTAKRFIAELNAKKLPNTVIGSDWAEIAESITNLIRAALVVRSNLRTDAKCINSKRLVIKTEYDFQNLIYLVLKPWLPLTEPEPFMISFGSHEKRADFAIEGNGLVIEAKHIRDTSTEAAVLKTLEGLKDFYQTSPNVRSLLFLILVDRGVNIDSALIEQKFSNKTGQIPTLVKILIN